LLGFSGIKHLFLALVAHTFFETLITQRGPPLPDKGIFSEIAQL